MATVHPLRRTSVNLLPSLSASRAASDSPSPNAGCSPQPQPSSLTVRAVRPLPDCSDTSTRPRSRALRPCSMALPTNSRAARSTVGSSRAGQPPSTETCSAVTSGSPLSVSTFSHTDASRCCTSVNDRARAAGEGGNTSQRETVGELVSVAMRHLRLSLRPVRYVGNRPTSTAETVLWVLFPLTRRATYRQTRKHP